MELPTDQASRPVRRLRHYVLGLPMTAVIDLDLTPNRGRLFQCIAGIARDHVGCHRHGQADEQRKSPRSIRRYPIEVTHPVVMEEVAGNPRVLVGRVIRRCGSRRQESPLPGWREKLRRRAGVQTDSPGSGCDQLRACSNSGSPCHAYDLDLLAGRHPNVRGAKRG